MESLEKMLAQAPELVVTYGIKLFFALVIFWIGRYLAKAIQKLTIKLLNSRKVDQTVVSFVSNLVWTVVFVFTLIAALGQIGIETASLVAVLGAAGLAVGLALQGSLSNFAAGVLMIMLRPCRVGDYIEAAGVAGSVDEITIFSTRLKTPDNKLILVPNSAIMNGSITNYSTLATRRVDLVIGVSYDADIRKTKKILTDILDSNSKVLDEPSYTVALNTLADSSVNFVVRPWVKSADYWPVYFDLLEQIKQALDDNGIGIPYPQVDLHVKELPVTPPKN